MRFTFSIDLLFLLTFLKINWRSTLHTNTRRIALGVGPVQNWQHGNENNAFYIVLRFWLTLGRSLHFFLGLLSLTLNVLCLLWVSLNPALWQIFVEHQIGIIFMGVVAKHLFSTVPRKSPLGCSSQIIIYKLLWQHHF